jgi:SGNH domain (fused to AT3 domains)
VVGLGGFVGTLVLTYSLTGTDALAYRGGFLVSALSAAAIILGAVCVAGGPIARALSVRPLVWMGTVSYGAYLWHYPVFIELDGGRTGLSGLSLLAVRMVATFALAAASYYLVERPVMEGVFWRSLKAAGPALVAMAVTVAVVVAGTTAAAAGAIDVAKASHIPAAEVQSLQSADAFSHHPVRFMFVGDSLSVTMGIGLAVSTVHDYGVTVINKGVLGCDIDPLPTISTTNGQQDDPVSPCAHWQTLWGHQVDTYRPEVVGVLIGRWNILDHVDGGQIVHIGQPAWDRHLTTEIDQVAKVLSAHGAKVVFFSMPYLSPPNETLAGAVSPADSPARVDDFNRILAQVAATHPGVVSVLDLNRILDPSGHFVSKIDGVTVRWADGIHISKVGGEWLQARVLPTIAQLGLEARATGRVGST